MQSFLQYRKIGNAVRKQIETKYDETHRCQDQAKDVVVRPAQDLLTSGPTISASHTSNVDVDLERIGSIATTRTQHSIRTALGNSLTGIHIRHRTTREGKGGKVFVVNWEGQDDHLNPRNWGIAYRSWITLILGSISFVVGAASSADAATLPQAAAEFGVSPVVESLAIGIYLAGYAVGALFAGPFSEIFGRNAVYISTMIIFMIFITASALAPNVGAQLAFRFLAGAFGATPLTCAGGSIADMWDSLDKTWAFPIFAIIGFAGPVLGPVIGSYVMNIGSWRWSEWIILLISGLVLGLIVLFQPETFPPLLLKWKAKHLRHQTGDNRFRAEIEITQNSLWLRLKIALTRAVLLALEPIVVSMTLYLTVLYIVLFTFLDGYTYIFQDVYGTSQGLTNVIFTGLAVGLLLAGLLVPWMYKGMKDHLATNPLVPEIRLWLAMCGAPAIPISLFWMAWTDFANVSIWSPILASVLFGYGTICIFISVYTYVIDSYEIYAASALTCITFTRYMTAGGMTVVGVPFYKNMGPHWTLTILGAISILTVPIPYVFYKYGHMIRLRSKYAESWT